MSFFRRKISIKPTLTVRYDRSSGRFVEVVAPYFWLGAEAEGL